MTTTANPLRVQRTATGWTTYIAGFGWAPLPLTPAATLEDVRRFAAERFPGRAVTVHA